MIMIRTLRRDIANYNRDDDLVNNFLFSLDCLMQSPTL